jgi:hypothetical protein
MICFMARECIHLKMELSTRETFKMALGTALASTLGLMGTNTTADGSRVIEMEWESSNGPMGIFTKAAFQIANEMASVSYGMLMETSLKVISRIMNGMVSI